MTGVWAYPWALQSGGISTEIGGIADRGIHELNIATAYHSIQTILPRGENGLFESYSGGIFFDPGDTLNRPPLEVPCANVPGMDDPLQDVISVATEHDITVNSWTVCNHGSRLGAANPTYRIESVFGEKHDHALCPSHPAVRETLAGIVKSIAEYNVDRIDLESLGFPGVFHGHGDGWGHLKNQVFATPIQQLLVSQCFCDACQSAATMTEVDFGAARECVRGLVRGSLKGPNAGPNESIDSLCQTYPVLADLFAFRTDIIEKLLSELAIASGDTGLNYYVADGLGRDVEDVKPSGVDLAQFDAYLDSVTAMCYTDDPDLVRRRVANIVDSFKGIVHAGVSLSPEFVGSQEDLQSLVSSIREETTGTVNLYNYSLCGQDQLDWIESVT